MAVARTAHATGNCEAAFEDLIGSIYEAALDPKAVPEVLQRLLALCGGVWSPLTILPTNGARLVSFQNAEADPDHVALFTQRYLSAETNPSVPLLLSAPSGSVLLRERYYSDSEFERFEMYQEVYRPIGAHDSLGIPVLKSAACIVAFGLLRPRESGTFVRGDLNLLGRAIPHLRRALQIMIRMTDLEGRAAAGLEAWDRLSHGVVVLDSARRVLWTNAVAGSLLARGDGLTMRAGLLCAMAPSQDATLQRLIGEAVGTGTGPVSSAGGVLAIQRSLLAHESLSILVSPLRLAPPMAGSMPGTPAAVVFISDPKSVAVAPPRALRALYGLTRREADLAALLADGLGIGEVADRMAISMNTARSHLRQVFEKTGTRRQAELVRLLTRSGIIGALSEAAGPLTKRDE